MAFFHLFRRFVLRPMRREKMRSLVAALGIALGVAVMVAIRLANTSVTDSFRAAMDSVSGNASLRIRGLAGPFDEQLLLQIAALRRQGQLSPVIESYAMVVGDTVAAGTEGSFPRGELLHVMGVDVLLDFDVRDYRVLQIGTSGVQNAREVLSLLVDPRSIILTEKFLRRHELQVGDTIRLTFDSQEQPFTIRGVLLDQGPARTLDGNFALMDIAAAQVATGRLGQLDYVDWTLPEGTDPASVLAEVRPRLPAELVVEYPDAVSRRADTMIAAFQFNLGALSAVALVVGLFLIYNTVATSVAARRAEVGMLRAVGARRGTILGLFLAEAALLALVGLVVGAALGRGMAQIAVRGAAQTVETFYIAGVAEASANHIRLSAFDALGVAAITVALALLAAWMPAREAAGVPPVEAVRDDRVRLASGSWRTPAAVGVACLLVAGMLTRAAPIGGKPVCGFLAELLFMLGAAMFTPSLLAALCGVVRRCGPRLLPGRRVELQLATANILGSLPQVSVSVAALGVSLAMMVAIAVMVGSFRETVVYWLNSALSADLSVKPVMQTSAVSEARLSPHAVDAIKQDPDVIDWTWFSSRQVPFGDATIRLAVTDLSKTTQRARLIFKARSDAAAPAIAGEERAIVSESFALRFGADCGSTFELPTPQGAVSCRVDAVYYDYASNQGTVMVDQGTYQRWFGVVDPGAAPQHVALYLRPGADPDQVRQRLTRRLGPREHLYCVTNAEIRTEALRIFESTFTITYALQGIAILVAGLGIAAALITLIYQRQRELALLALVGANRRQTRDVILTEAVLLAAASQLLGLALGLVLASVLIYVINVQSFGWTIQLRLPFRFLAASSLSVLAAAALFGLYPAVLATRSDPLQIVREE